MQFRSLLAAAGTRLVLLTLVATAIAVATLWVSALERARSERNDAIAAEIQKNTNLAQSHQERAASSLAVLDQAVLFLRAEYLSHGLSKSLEEQLRAVQVKQKFVTNVALIGAQGQSLANTAGSLTTNYADREYFQAHATDPADKLVIGKPVVGRISGNWVITMSRRINRPDGSFGGVVRLSVDAAYFARDYAKTTVGPNASMALIGLDGITRARRNGYKISFGEEVSASQLFKELPKAANGHYTAVAASDGVRRVISYRSLEDYPMVAIVASSLDDVLAVSRERERVYLTGAALGTLVALGFAVMLLVGSARRAEIQSRMVARERHHREALEQSLADLEHTSAALERTGTMAKVGGWELNLLNQKITWTPETYRIHEVDLSVAPVLATAIEFYAPEARPIISAAVQSAIEQGTPFDLEVPFVSARGRHLWVRSQGVPVMENGKVIHLYGAFQDVTDRVQAQAERRALADRLLLATRAGGIGIWDWDIVNNKLVWDDAMFTLYGVPANQFAGAYEAWRAGVHPDDQARTDAEAQAARDGVKDYDTEFRVVWPNGEVRTLRALASIQRESNGVAVRMVGTNWDITPQKAIEVALQTSVAEKEALLKEVHHRVKNNLQVITSLLRMESRRSSVPEAVALLKGMQGRVFAMAQLHESLYRSGTFASIDLGVYLGRIASETFKTHLLEGQQVQLQLQMGSVPVGMDQAISCGLLVNELVSNCLKHGLPQGKSGEVRVELQPIDPATVDADALWRLQVRDTGIGLPPDFEDKRKTSLGLQLVGDLSQQARGTLTISSQSGAGASFTIILKVLPPQALVMP